MIYKTVEDLSRSGGIASIDPQRPDDLYIVAATFEPRGTALSRALAVGYRARTSFIYVNRDLDSTSAANIIEAAVQQLRGDLQTRSDSSDIIEGSWADARKQVESLAEAFSRVDIDEPATITIDITTFNREALIVCLALLRSRFPSARIRALYVSPGSHGPWLSRGFRNVRSIVGFAGVQQPSRPTLLMALSGFEGDRTVKLIEEYEPSRVLLGLGDPPTLPNFLERNISEHKLVLSRTDVEEFRFPANNVAECDAVLERKITSLLDSYNVVISPMSTKLSTVAAFQVASRHSDVQLAYSLPGEYNWSDYSQGTSHVFIEELETPGASA